MKFDDQSRTAATPLTLGGTKRQWSTPQIIEADLGSTQKPANPGETTDPGYYVQLGPS